jgi:SAM-dependent methyltransferase
LHREQEPRVGPFDPARADRVHLYRSVFDSRNPTRRHLHHERNARLTGLLNRYAAGKRCLEVGIGGNLYRETLRIVPRFCVRLDIDAEFVRFSSFEDKQSPPPHPFFMQGDLLRLPFADGSFDLVFCSEVFEHLPPGRSLDAFGEIRRVLAPSGKLILSTPQSHSSVELIMRLATSRLFRAIACRIYPEAIIDNEHINLLTRRQLLAEAAQSGFQPVESGRCGLYIPLLAEFGGEWGRRISSSLEPIFDRSPAGFLLWTQYHVLS